MTKICNDNKGTEKQNNALMSFLTALVAGMVLAHLSVTTEWLTPLASGGLAAGVGLLAGVGKTAWEATRPGKHFCVWSLLYDLAGAVAGGAMGALATWGINATF